jgi:hypothetical protein
VNDGAGCRSDDRPHSATGMRRGLVNSMFMSRVTARSRDLEGNSLQASAPPRWAVVIAHVAAVTPLPSAIWRVLLVFGLTAGYTEMGLARLDIGGSGWVYLVILSVVTELAALLTLGLVQPWGEVVPRWIPFVGGRAIPSEPVVIAAGIGAVALTVLWTPLLLWWSIDHTDMTPVGAVVVGTLYLPLVAWGPLLAAVTVSHALRRKSKTHRQIKW